MSEIVDNLDELFSGKNVKVFSETTPDGNIIGGKILLNHGFYHGSLLIETVNDKPVQQFVRGFPKIHYFEDSMEDSLDDEIIGYEKLDGTCVGFYRLYDEKGNMIEVVPKSRQRAVLDEHFRDMLKFCDTRLIYNKIDLYDLNAVYVEMFGMLNEHTLPHKKTYIDLRLIGAVNKDGVLVSKHYLKTLSLVFGVDLPRRIVSIHKHYFGRINIFEGYSVHFSNNIFETVSDDKCNVKSFWDVVSIIKDHLDYCNNIYKEEKGYLFYEGVVLQNDVVIDDGSVTMRYVKIKPESFLSVSKGEGSLSISLNEIRKEVWKIINENLTDYSENYNEREALLVIEENLLEEYDEEDVYHSKTRKVIVRELHKYIDSIQDKSVNKIVETILKDNPSDNPQELMRYFADNYPLLKHKSRDVYFVLTKQLKKRG